MEMHTSLAVVIGMNRARQAAPLWAYLKDQIVDLSGQTSRAPALIGKDDYIQVLLWIIIQAAADPIFLAGLSQRTI